MPCNCGKSKNRSAGAPRSTVTNRTAGESPKYYVQCTDCYELVEFDPVALNKSLGESVWCQNCGTWIKAVGS